jgi:hypothetical protein
MSENMWNDSVYGDAISAESWPNEDPLDALPNEFIGGMSAKGFGRSPVSTYIERPDLLTGLSGQPEQPRYR